MKYVIIILSIVTLVSCGIQKRDYEISNPVQVNNEFLAQELQDSIFNHQENLTKWWTAFGDPILDSLIERTRDNNLDIHVAIANFKASRAALTSTKFDRWPVLTTNASYNRTRLGENVFVPGMNPTYSTYSGSIDAVWETDIFGRVSNRIKGAYAYNQVVLSEMQAVYLRIFAEVANHYIELRGTQYLLDIAERNLKGQQDTYDLTLKLSDAGTSNSLDVSRALAQLESTRASIPPLQARIEALKNSLSVLVGEIPGKLSDKIIDKKPLPSLPSTVELGSIQDLLRRRPDVRRAEAALQMKISAYNIAVTDLYPKIEFGGSVGFSAVDFANFGSKESFTWSLLPNISWAAFNLGKVKQQIKKNDAETLAALEDYEKVVLESLEEIKTSLSNYAHELKRREILKTSSSASLRAAEIAEKRFNAGLDNFIDYLSADNALLIAENSLARSEISSANALIAIYKALGGGWEIISKEELDQQFEAIKRKEP